MQFVFQNLLVLDVSTSLCKLSLPVHACQAYVPICTQWHQGAVLQTYNSQSIYMRSLDESVRLLDNCCLLPGDALDALVDALICCKDCFCF